MRGLVVGIVTNIDDPDQMGRVKVRFPWLDGPDQAVESHWARVTGWYAGNSRGTMQIPEVGDEVMVAFGHGDPNHPYVIGAVWNGEHAVPGPGNPDGKNDHKWFRSRAGHDFEFLDTDGGEKIRLVDSSTNNSMVIDTPADTITTEAKTGTINIQAPKGHIQVDCVDLVMKTTEGRNLEVGTTHTVTVGQNRTVGVSKANLIQLAGNSLTVTTPTFKSSTGSAVGVSAGALAMNQGTISTEVKGWSEVQQGPVTRTVGSQKVTSDDFRTLNTEGTPSGPLTILAGNLMTQADGGIIVEGSLVTVMAGMLNGKGGSMLVAKDGKGGKAALSTWLGGLLLLNPNTLTFPATKLLDPILGLDFHTTLPSLTVPPLPPLPFFPAPFAGPILIDFKPTVLINFRPAAGSGATALSFHMPPLPWPWPPISHRPLITAAIMALMTAPFTALLEMGRAKVQAMAAASNNETFQRGFVADVLGSSHVQPTQQDQTKGKSFGKAAGNQGTFSFTRLFPMFSSAQAFLGFLAGLAPLPIANASVTIASPTTTVCDAPLGMMIPLGANSCSDIPIVPNAAVVGFSNVLTGMSIGDFLGQLAWNAIQGAATMGFQAGVKKAGNAAARRIARSNNPRLQNVAQRVNDFVGGDNCIARGHPVDVASGTMFDAQDDFTLYSDQTMVFRRLYNARARTLPGESSVFGPGWRHVFDEGLIADDDADGVRTLAYRTAEGRVLGFELPLEDAGEDFHPSERLTLTRVDGRTYAIKDRHGMRRVFRFPGGDGRPTGPGYVPGVGNRARLVEVHRPASAAPLRVLYDGDRLRGFVDPGGRRVTAALNGRGRLVTLTLTEVDGKSCDQLLARYGYDRQGRLVEHTDANGHARRFEYDASDRMTRAVDRNGYGFVFRYDVDDRCVLTHADDNAFWCQFEYTGSSTTVTDGLGGVTRYKLDEANRVTDIVDALGGVTARAYTDEGWLESVTDPNSAERTWVYDDRGRVVEETDARGGVVKSRFDARGHLEAIVERDGGEWPVSTDEHGLPITRGAPSGRVERLERDPHGRLVQQETPDGGVWRRTLRADGLPAEDLQADGRRDRFDYDLCGRLTRYTQVGRDGRQRTTRIRRDGMGRIIEIVRPDGAEERYALYPEGQIKEMTRDGRTTRYRFEGLGRLAEREDALGRKYRLRHDLEQRVIGVDLPGGRTWTYRRDLLGRVIAVTAPDGRHIEQRYDPGGQLIEQTHPDGRTLQMAYDGNGNLTEQRWSDAAAAKFAYDACDRLIGADAPGDRPVERRYDADGFLTVEVQGDAVVRIDRTFDGRPTRLRTSWDTIEQLDWAPDGQLAARSAGGRDHHIERDGFGRRALERLPGGMSRRWSWDERDRMVGESVADQGEAPLMRRALDWSDGRIARVEHAQRGSADGSTAPDRVATRVDLYRYDDGGRVATHRRDDGPERVWRFDDADNLLVEPGGPDRTYAGDRVIGDETGRTWRYDARGRVTAIAGKGGARHFGWDARGRLTSVVTADDRAVHHTYDAIGRRASTVYESVDGTVREERCVWLGDHLLRRVWGTSGQLDDAPDRDERYRWDPERNLPLGRTVRRRTRQGVVEEEQLYHTDQRGAVVGLTDLEGRWRWLGGRDPYGRDPGHGPEAAHQPLRLQGQVRDPGSGLAHHRFRVFDPETARFLSPDPIGLDGGPNLYGWPADPIRLADPLGLDCSSDAAELRKNMVAAGDTEPSFEHAAHHIVQSNSTDSVSEATRAHLASHGVDINDSSNGVFLPRGTAVKNAAGSSAVPHSRVHTNHTRQQVHDRITSQTSAAGIRTELASIKSEMLAGTWNTQPP